MKGDSVLVDILSLVEVFVSEEIVSAWTDEQCELAEDWASRYYLRASDNIIKVPKKPEFLEQYSEGKRNV
jgi:hypothetical protein